MNLTHFSNLAKKTIWLDNKASLRFLLVVGPLLTILMILLLFSHKYSSASTPECTENVGGWWKASPIVGKRYQFSTTSNRNYNTYIRADEYACVTSGWMVGGPWFDYNEGDKSTIGIWPHTGDDGYWYISAYLPSDDGDYNQVLYVDLVCFSNEITYWSGESPLYIDHNP